MTIKIQIENNGETTAPDNFESYRDAINYLDACENEEMDEEETKKTSELAR